MLNQELHIGKWRVEPRAGRLEASGRRVRIKPKVMDLLAHFARHPGRVLSKESLLETLWNGSYVTENTLMNAISELRKALGDDVRKPVFIETLPKRGYRLIATVDGASDAAPAPRATTTPKRIVVLPFEDFAKVAAEKHLAEVMTVLVGEALAYNRSLRVISRVSSTAISKTPLTLPEIARQLEAERIVEGSLLRFQDALEIVIHLYNAADEPLLSEIFTTRTTPTEAVLKDLAHEIAERVTASEIK